MENWAKRAFWELGDPPIFSWRRWRTPTLADATVHVWESAGNRVKRWDVNGWGGLFVASVGLEWDRADRMGRTDKMEEIVGIGMGDERGG